jgi:hypothetical protein
MTTAMSAQQHVLRGEWLLPLALPNAMTLGTTIRANLSPEP